MQALLACDYCRFSIRPRAEFLSVDYCPRCLARRHVAEPLHPIDDDGHPVGPITTDRRRTTWPSALP